MTATQAKTGKQFKQDKKMGVSIAWNVHDGATNAWVLAKSLAQWP